MSFALPAFWKRHKPLLLAFVLAVATTGFFAVKLVIATVYWSDPAHRDQHIEGWMTPGYIAHSWNVPPEVIGTELGLQPGGTPKRITLDDIARERGVAVDTLIQQIEAAIAASRGRN
ncbi:hypothetical protein VK792_12235 [Mesobacterium sp. TK19101]|uniref:Uncharacterized protein n=1 Tax=Mesobacterium hydrothermale TaxID=3111907 RepID=A0ABU6HLK9_9RHOB|nr:hypothetical protein [Mesobacterium sp. TK19101]MEC3862055.1 hypothetical protein [Mesobacterium sp. TK19101]